VNLDDPHEIPRANLPTDAPVAPAICDEPDGTPPPRLGVIHLLAWLTIAAVLFGIDRSARILEKASKHPDWVVSHYPAIDTVRLAAMAAGAVGLVALVRWRAGGRPRPLAPGHWILAAEIIAMLLVYGVEIARRMIAAVSDHADPRTSFLPVIAVYALIAMAQMLAFAAAVLRCLEKGGWQWIFGLLAVASAAHMTLDAILFLIIAEWL
jgi:hypothetical protein